MDSQGVVRRYRVAVGALASALLLGIAVWPSAALAQQGHDAYAAADRVNAVGSQLPDFVPGPNQYVNTSNCGAFDTLGNCTAPFTAGETLPGGQAEFNSCGGHAYSATAWFEVHPDVPGTVSVYVRGNSIAGNTFDGVINAFQFNLSTGVPSGPYVNCTDAEPASGTEQLFFDVKGGEHWKIQVGGRNGEVDFYEIRFGFLRDTDGDGKYDFQDSCPTQNGTLSNGCPAPPPPPPRPDTDHDNVFDDGPDKCVGENAILRDPDGNGCLNRELLHPSIVASWGNFYKGGRSLGLKAKSVTVSDITAGTKVQLSCTKHACRTKAGTLRGKKTRLTIKLKKNLRAGVRLKVRITKSGAVGRYVSYKILRKNYLRDARIKCIKAGGTTAVTCSSKLWVR